MANKRSRDNCDVDKTCSRAKHIKLCAGWRRKQVYKSHQKERVEESSLSVLLSCPVCAEKLNCGELHLGIVFCDKCEAEGRSFDIDTGSEETTRNILSKLAI